MQLEVKVNIYLKVILHTILDLTFGNWLFDRTDRKLVSCGQIKKSGYSISDRNLLVLNQYGQKTIICRL